MPVYSIESGMAEALGHLKRVAQHFADNGHPKIANELGRLSISIVNTFSGGIEQIPAALYQLDHDQSDYNQITGTMPVTGGNAIQRQAATALMNQVNNENVGFHGPSTALQRVPAPDDKFPPADNWAQAVTRFPAHLQDGGQYMPPRVATAALPGPRQSSSEDEDSMSQMAGMAVAHYSPLSPEMPAEAKAGVIRVHGKLARDFVQFITTRIHEGPLQDIRTESRACVRITFQHVAQALAFLKSNQDMEQMLGFGRFGGGYHVELAEVVDWNDDHRRMNQPIRERRRLSFARKRLFADNMTPEKWRHDVRNLAGAGNIDFLWVFNSGNATAVFTSTTVARQVLEIFNQWKVGQGEYSEVCVSYSSDPCEKELVLARDGRGARNLARRPAAVSLR
ncbi:hypothetical protein PHISP_07988 [Aspergillus sp. HF37]|nr:hypothetical protein PHISP_07988 [Aspergillus sp. HF37]